MNAFRGLRARAVVNVAVARLATTNSRGRTVVRDPRKAKVSRGVNAFLVSERVWCKYGTASPFIAGGAHRVPCLCMMGAEQSLVLNFLLNESPCMEQRQQTAVHNVKSTGITERPQAREFDVHSSSTAVLLTVGN